MKLLIHHHAVAFKDSNGIWIQSFIGNWINNLAYHFEEVGLLVHISKNKKNVQDTCINNKKVILHSLGAPGIMWDKIQRTFRIRAVCWKLKNNYDFLLIRGMTPRQHIIWNNVEVTTSRKYFLLVGTPKSSYSLKSIISFAGIFNYYMEQYRQFELRNMLKNGSLTVNSPTLIKESDEILNEKAIFIPTNSISKNDFTPFNVKEIKPNCISLLFVSRVIKEKGVIEAIESVRLLKEKGIDCKLDIVGPIDKLSFKKYLNDLIQDLKIKADVNFHGFVNFGENLLNIYRSADIFILPTYWGEGFPHVIWEAAASCCPIISSPAGGIPALIQDRHHALLIPEKTTELLVDSIIELINNKSLRSKIVTNAYNLAKEYTVESCAKKLADVILTEKEIH